MTPFWSLSTFAPWSSVSPLAPPAAHFPPWTPACLPGGLPWWDLALYVSRTAMGMAVGAG
jgi:hypothetical protein